MIAKVIDTELVSRVLDAARASSRRRTNHNFHASDEDNPHRFLNVMLRDTYVRPHRHVSPPKCESFIVLEGQIAVFLFDDEGTIVERHDLDPRGVRGVDLPPSVWHSLVVLSDHVVIFEVKPGPWDPATDKEMAPWAPPEGDPRALAFARGLLEAAATP